MLIIVIELINEIIGIYDDGHNRTIYILRKESDNYVNLYTINDSIKKTIANINYIEKGCHKCDSLSYCNVPYWL